MQIFGKQLLFTGILFTSCLLVFAGSYKEDSDLEFTGTLNSVEISGSGSTATLQTSEKTNWFNPSLSPSWWDVDWAYRRKVVLQNNGEELTDYQIKLNLPIYDESGLQQSLHFEEYNSSYCIDSSANTNAGKFTFLSTSVDNCDSTSGWSAGYGSITLNTSRTKEGTGALNLTKSGTSIDNMYSKSISLTDMSSQFLSVWVYIKDSTALSKISNVQLYIFDILPGWNWFEREDIAPSSLTTGWNLLYMDTANPSITSGSVDLTQTSAIRIDVDTNTDTDTFSEGEIIIDDWTLSDNQPQLPEITDSGRFGKGISFNGINSYLTVKQNASLNFGTGSFSVGCWIYPLSSSYKKIITQSDTSSPWRYMALRFLNGKLSFDLRASGDGSVTQMTADDATTLNEWHYVTGIFDSTNNQIKLYMDGKLAATPISYTPAGNFDFNSSSPLYIGTSLNPAEFFSGTIDEVKIYSRALSGNDIYNNYNTPLNPNYSDIRFIDSSGNELSYWMEHDGLFWINVPTISPGQSALFAYYGNNAASSQSNGDDVFLFFDEFNQEDIDLTKWTLNTFEPNYYSMGNGSLKLWSDNSTYKKIKSSYTSISTEDITADLKYLTKGNNTSLFYFDNLNVERFGIQPFVLSNTGPRIQYLGSPEGLQSNPVYANASVDEWYIHQIDRFSQSVFTGSTCNLEYNKLGSDSISDSIWGSIDFSLIFTENQNVNSYIDWIRIRKYAQNPPIIFSIGSEVSQNSEWSYRKPLTLTNPNSMELEGYQILIENPLWDTTSLKGIWHFDEYCGNIIYDSSGNNNSGEMKSAQWVNGYCDGGLEFDGFDSDQVGDWPLINSVAIPTSSSLEITGAITLEAWVYAKYDSSSPPSSDIYSKEGSFRFIIYPDPTDFSMLQFSCGLKMQGIPWAEGFISDSNGYPLSYYPINNKWSYLVATYDGAGSIKYYLNGEIVGDFMVLDSGGLPAGPLETNSNDVYIGVRTEDTAPPAVYRPFQGLLDEVAVYNRALSADEILARFNSNAKLNYGDLRFVSETGDELAYWKENDGKFWVKTDSLQSMSDNLIYLYYGNDYASLDDNIDFTFTKIIEGLVGSWDFDELSGLTAKDMSGNGNDGTLTFGPERVLGKYGNAIKFDGIDDRIDITSASSLNTFSEITLEAYASSTNPGSDEPIIAKEGASGIQEYLMGIKTNEFGALLGNNWTLNTRSGGNESIDSDTWNHYSITWNGNNVTDYINGYQVDSASWSGPISQGSSILSIGANSNGGTTWFEGIIDEVRIYNRALTTTEINLLGNNRGYTSSLLPGKVLIGNSAEKEIIVSNPASDNFDETNINSQLWDTIGDITQNGTLNLTTDLSNNTAGVDATNKWYFTGDFDCQVDFDASQWTGKSPSSARWKIKLLIVTADYFYLMSYLKDNLGTISYLQNSNDPDITWDTGTTQATLAINGTMRIVRNGNSIQMFALKNNNWTFCNNASSPNIQGPFYVMLLLADGSTANPIQCSLDNFTVNSGYTYFSTYSNEDFKYENSGNYVSTIIDTNSYNLSTIYNSLNFSAITPEDLKLYIRTADNENDISSSIWEELTANPDTDIQSVGRYFQYKIEFLSSSAYFDYINIDYAIPPGQPTLLWPDNASTDIKINPSCIWASPLGDLPLTYSLEIDDNDDFSSPEVSLTNITDTVTDISDLEYNTTYYWHIMANNLTGAGEWSQTFSFKTEAEIIPSSPSVTSQASPTNNATDENINLTLVWLPSTGSGTITYNLQLSKISDFSNLILDISDIDTAYYNVTSLDYDALYFWRIKAINEYGESEWSDVWDFTTATEINPASSEPNTFNVINENVQDLIDSNEVKDGDTIKLSGSSSYTDSITISKEIILENGIFAPTDGYAIIGQEENDNTILRNCVILSGGIKNISRCENLTLYNPDPNSTILIENCKLINCLIEKGATVINSSFQYCWAEADETTFTNANNSDLSLAPSATYAIDQGLALSDEFTYDILGVQRGIDIVDIANDNSGAWDIGAFEYILSKGYINIINSENNDEVINNIFAPDMPILLYPELNSTLLNKGVFFNWKPYNDNEITFWIQIANDSDFNSLLLSQAYIVNNSYTSSINSAGTIWWRVKAMKNNYESEWSDSSHFNLVNETTLSHADTIQKSGCFIKHIFK